TVFLSIWCVKRRSTRTTTVLFCLSLTTTPCSIRFGIFVSSLRFLRAALLPGDGLDARDVAPHLTHPRGVLELPARPLETQVKALLPELHQLVAELIERHDPDVRGFHRLLPANRRCARRSAS